MTSSGTRRSPADGWVDDLLLRWVLVSIFLFEREMKRSIVRGRWRLLRQVARYSGLGMYPTPGVRLFFRLAFCWTPFFFTVLRPPPPLPHIPSVYISVIPQSLQHSLRPSNAPPPFPSLLCPIHMYPRSPHLPLSLLPTPPLTPSLPLVPSCHVGVGSRSRWWLHRDVCGQHPCILLLACQAGAPGIA